MRVIVFCHSLISDWNHGNAHFLRGIVSELLARGHDVRTWEPADAWSLANLTRDHGLEPRTAFQRAYPTLRPRQYDADLDLDAALDGADLVIVHEWNDPALVARIGNARGAGGEFLLLFHDTHHRAITAADEMAGYDLRHYDGVLAFGSILREIYLERGWTQRAWTWHEAADTRVFRPLPRDDVRGDLVWIGNWGDDERSAELREFLVDPVRELGLRAAVHGVRYPDDAQQLLVTAGIRYDGWLPNFLVPRVFAHYRATLHVPRRPYARSLPGIPTIRPFEAMACGIPLVSAPWDDTDGLFRAGTDYLVARNAAEMQEQLRCVLTDPVLAESLAISGRRTILERHSCVHRVDELLQICHELGRTVAGDEMPHDLRQPADTARRSACGTATATATRVATVRS
ncbi:glycosyltransferase [soil metagenome]